MLHTAVLLAQRLSLLQGNFLLLGFAFDQVFLIADEHDAQTFFGALGTDYFYQLFGSLKCLPVCHIVDHKKAFRCSVVTLCQWRKLGQSGRVPHLSLDNLIILHGLLLDEKFHPDCRIMSLRRLLLTMILHCKASLADARIAHYQHFIHF